MASFKAIVNPFTGNLTLIRADSAFHLKDGVDTYNDLPISGNTENDVRITADTDKMYTWGISSSSGQLTDWKEIGSSSSVDWSSIQNKPSSSVANIDDAVDKKHTQGTDQKLDDGGANEVVVADIKDAVSKKHDKQHAIDSSSDHTSTITENNLMDADSNGLPDDSGLSVSDVSDAVSKKHTQNTDNTIIFTEAPSSDHTATGVKSTFTAGESLVFGDICYFKSDGKMWKADADASTTMPVMAMALESITADESGSFLLIGIARDDSWAWTVGATLYVDTTAGALTETAPSGSGDVVQAVAIATHADRIYFKPDLTTIEIA